MRKNLIFLGLFMACSLSKAQSIKEKSINAIIGYGVSTPYDSSTDIVENGFFMQGEYVLKLASWFDLRPYAGFITTSSNGKDLNNNPTFEKAEIKALLLGGKARLRAPIPYIAPYLEIGIGTSIGKFETFTAFDYVDKSGIIFHIPFAFGFEFGKFNNVDVGFTYYFQPVVKQVAGAFACGITIPLKN